METTEQQWRRWNLPRHQCWLQRSSCTLTLLRVYLQIEKAASPPLTRFVIPVYLAPLPMKRTKSSSCEKGLPSPQQRASAFCCTIDTVPRCNTRALWNLQRQDRTPFLIASLTVPDNRCSMRRRDAASAPPSTAPAQSCVPHHCCRCPADTTAAARGPPPRSGTSMTRYGDALVRRPAARAARGGSRVVRCVCRQAVCRTRTGGSRCPVSSRWSLA